MALINYLARVHLAEQAIEDALPEEGAGVRRALVLADGSDATVEVVERVRAAMRGVRITQARVTSGRAARANRLTGADPHTESGPDMVIAVGDAVTSAHARQVVAAARQSSQAVRFALIPSGLFDMGLARHVRDADGTVGALPRPDVIIADPSTLAGLDEDTLAAGAMEMLVHAIEAFANPSYNPPADALALDAVRLLSLWLPHVERCHRDAAARCALMSGALMAALSLEKPIGGVDALVHPLEALVADTCPAGALHGPVLAAVAGFNAPAVGDRYAAIADALSGAKPPASMPLGARVRALAAAAGLPVALRETALDPADFPTVARTAADDPGALANPRRLSVKDYGKILEAAW
jgi:alcohol dehydrogenase class IV